MTTKKRPGGRANGHTGQEYVTPHYTPMFRHWHAWRWLNVNGGGDHRYRRSPFGPIRRQGSKTKPLATTTWGARHE